MTIDNIKKLFTFSWSQAFSDQNGKSSIIPVSGWYLVFLGGIVLLIGAWRKDGNTMMYGLGEATLGAGLLGYKKAVDGKSEGSFPILTDDNEKILKEETTKEVSKVTKQITSS